jgi:hypothetical protein
MRAGRARQAVAAAAVLAGVLVCGGVHAQFPTDGPTPDIFLHRPAWTEADGRHAREAAADCFGAGADPILLNGRVLYSGQANSLHGVRASPSGVVAITTPASRPNQYQASIYPDGVDHDAFVLPFGEGDIVAVQSLSNDGRYVSWPDLSDHVVIVDIRTRKPVQTPQIDCSPRESRWLGDKLFVSCGDDNVGAMLFAPAGDEFRRAAVFQPVALSDAPRRAIVDESGTVFVRGDKVYATIDAVLAEAGLPDFPQSLDERSFRLGDHVLQLAHTDPHDADPFALTLRDIATGRVLSGRTLTRTFTEPSGEIDTCAPVDNVRLEMEPWSFRVAAAPDGRWFAALIGHGDVIETFDGATLAPLAVYALNRSPYDAAVGLAILPDGRLLAWSDMDVDVYTPPAR